MSANSANFEEKTYENYFNAELDCRSSVFFPPGQVQEGSLGFDASAHSKNRFLWKKLGFPFWFFPHYKGLDLIEIADEMEHHLKVSIQNLPSIKANILFQYKRPEYMKTSRAKEWEHWNEPYYRYDIYHKQHDLLNHIDKKFGNDILIIYASPAVKDINELVKLKQNKKIIECSNFTKSSKLNANPKHHRNTYTQSGTYSIACSEPEKNNSMNILKELENLSNQSIQSSNLESMTSFSSNITSLMYENDYYKESFRILCDEIQKFEDFKLLHSLLLMKIFNQLTGLQWVVKI